MANITPPYADPGRASFETLDTYLQDFLLAGNHPELKQAYSFDSDTATELAQFAVVGLDTAGEIVAAITGSVDPDDDIQAIGVLAHAKVAGDLRAHVFYSGAFNMDALVWDDSFDTDAKKEAAFRGAPTPTTIIIAKRGA